MPRPAQAMKTRAQYHHLATTLRDLEEDLRWGLEGSARIPPEWHAIAQGVPAPLKVKQTLRLDGDVVAFFRSMGAGHLTRMNAVLRAFMHARLAGVVKGAEAVEYAPTPFEAYVAEAEGLVEMTSRRNALARAGRDTVALDVEIDRRVAGLRRMEEALGLEAEERVTG
ncbi:MAG: BrnA antitoxin family protein [Paracoccaceae bacterium]